MTAAALALTALALSAPDAQSDLFAAARGGDVRKLAAAIDARADVNRRDAKGQTALMLAARKESFATCRELLWAGADATLEDKSGRDAAEQIQQETEANLPLRMLLRAYAYLQKNAQRSSAKPKEPPLVMIMEDTVNYLHPKLATAYQVNRLEEVGVTGQDDNRNGFVDDVYGWRPDHDQPYVIRAAQLDAYVKYKDAIARIIQIDNDEVEGRISSAEARKRLDEFTNPLSDIMGPVDALTDRKFLEMLSEAAHGSHVAGIVLDASEGRARLHTLAHDFPEESRRMLGPDTERILDELHAKSFDHAVVLRQIRDRLLERSRAIGKVSSRYLQAQGAGVANLSFGGGVGFWRVVAEREVMRCYHDHIAMDPASDLDEPIDVLARRYGLELYTACAAEVALVCYENPDVLFVISAGNESQDNDETYTCPAYLSRFFPNVITVASTGEEDQLSSFSNYGVDSVNVGAPGEAILSTVIPEASMHMNGTSMAAPYVSGVAALIRSLAPQVTASELRRLVEYTARDVEELHRFVSSGGAIDKQALLGLFQGDARARSNAKARIASNAVSLSDELYPRRAADAERAAIEALALDQSNAEAWLARARTFGIAGDLKKALEHVDRCLELDPKCEPGWMDRAAIQAELKNNDAVLQAFGRAIAVLEERGESANFLRARRLVQRADLLRRLGRKNDARSDLRAALDLNPGVELTTELELLLQ